MGGGEKPKRVTYIGIGGIVMPLTHLCGQTAYAKKRAVLMRELSDRKRGGRLQVPGTQFWLSWVCVVQRLPGKG